MDEDRVATIAGGVCRACEQVFAPWQDYGCERCGATGAALEPRAWPATGIVASAATVHVHRQPTPPTPFGVAEVVLDAGPVIRVLTDNAVAIGQRVIGDGSRFAAA